MRERHAGHYADRRQAQAVAQNHPHHLAASRAHGHAHADFGGAAIDTIGQRSVEAGSDEHDGEQAEELSEAREHDLTGDGGVVLRALRHGFDQRQIWIKLLHDFLRGGKNGKRRAIDAHFHVISPMTGICAYMYQAMGIGVSSMLRYL